MLALVGAALGLAAFRSAGSTLPTDRASTDNPDVFWSRKVEPLLDKKCLKCHAGVRQYGGLDLRSIDTILRGGEHGPAMIPGRPAESRLLQFVQPASGPHMPPDKERHLTPEEVSILKGWIALLPQPKSRLASGTSTDNSWAGEYLADYRRLYLPHRTPPAGLPPAAVIDWFLRADWRRDGVVSARPCDDSTFVRRIYLDIAGRIPRPEERTAFLADFRKDKRSLLVERLIASADYPVHMREVFDTALMGRPAGKNGRDRAENGWFDFLEDGFRSNRPWNDLVRDMLLARKADGPRRGAVQFIAEKNNSHQAIAEAVAPLVFGVQIKCAQCHNHPLVWEIEQRHYWGLVAAFNRSKNVKTESGIGIAESATGGFINFANLKKESQPAALVFLNGTSVPERVPKADEKEVDSPDLYLVPPAKEGQKAKSAAVPIFSRRESFADAATRSNPMLARAFVNRMWAIFMGRGLVQPVDQLDSRHRASHPDLLDWLSRDFEQSGYDIKRLVRTLVLSRAYQLDSRPAGTAPPLPETFARSLEKPLSAEQLLRSLRIAAGTRTEETSVVSTDRAFTAVFPELMPDTYNPSLQQALFLSNSPVLDAFLKPDPGSTTSKLLSVSSKAGQVREAFLAVLGRAPDAVELQQCQSALAGESPESGVKNLLWALLTCTEFKVNH